MERVFDWMFENWNIVCPVWVTVITLVAVYVLWNIFHEPVIVRFLAKVGIVEIDDEDEER